VGHIEFSFLTRPWKSDITLFEPAGLLLAAASLLLVNGIIVPIAEEWLLRGIIQPRLTGSPGFLAGLLITSVLFSLKHVIIDTSLGRLLTVTGFGMVMGVTAALWLAGVRSGTRAGQHHHHHPGTCAERRPVMSAESEKFKDTNLLS